MTDLIRRHDAIDAIHCDIEITGTQNARIVSETIAAFIDRIKALPSAEPKRGEWIPVSERLPEKYGVYLTTNNMWGKEELLIDCYADERWQHGGTSVVAWMPLPEPYKEGIK